jgi:glycosyltransferase involved in cell wall biosynthesis
VIIEIAPMDPGHIEGGVFTFVDTLMKVLKKKSIDARVLGVGYHKKNQRPKYGFTSIVQLKRKKFAEIRYLLGLFFTSGNHIKKDDIIHAHRLEHILPFLLKKNPKIVTFHTNPRRAFLVRRGRLAAKLYTLYEHMVLKHHQFFGIKKLVFVDTQTCQAYKTLFPDIAKISVALPTGIDTKRFHPMDKDALKKKYGFKNYSNIIISVGRLTKEKDLKLALHAYKLIEDHTKKTLLIIIGDGPERDNLEQLSKTLKIRQCIFLGALHNEQIPEYLNCADALVLTSTYEGMPRTVLEALACGVPVVSTDVGGIRQIIKRGLNGEVITGRDPKKFSQTTASYLNQDLRGQCVASIRTYTIENVTQHYIHYFRRANRP